MVNLSLRLFFLVRLHLISANKVEAIRKHETRLYTYNTVTCWGMADATVLQYALIKIRLLLLKTHKA